MAFICVTGVMVESEPLWRLGNCCDDALHKQFEKQGESGRTFTTGMKMIRFDDLALFARTAALGSFSNAAREADLLPGQVSAAIQRLERELDVRLFAMFCCLGSLRFARRIRSCWCGSFCPIN